MTIEQNKLDTEHTDKLPDIFIVDIGPASAGLIDLQRIALDSKPGCVYTCSDPECNMPTFAKDAICCEHCGKTEHYYSHPGEIFSDEKHAFVCSWCGSLDITA